nr:YerC/YecD family TrpR-related protein [Candidatus Gracilibacteria bacterium]
MEDNELKRIFKDIVTYLSITNNNEKIFNFLRDLLSESEIIEFSKRFEVARMLDEKKSYKEIELNTGMSSTTIARISKFLSGENRGYKEAIITLKSAQSNHHVGHQS